MLKYFKNKKIRLGFPSLFLYITIMKRKRIWCEDTSPTLRAIRASKSHGRLVKINGIEYEQIGSDMLYDPKTSRVRMLAL